MPYWFAITWGGAACPPGLWGCPAVTVFYGVDAPLERFLACSLSPDCLTWCLLDQPRLRLHEYSRRRRGQVALAAGGGGLSIFIRGQAPRAAKRNRGLFRRGAGPDKVRPKRSAICWTRWPGWRLFTVMGGREAGMPGCDTAQGRGALPQLPR